MAQYSTRRFHINSTQCGSFASQKKKTLLKTPRISRLTGFILFGHTFDFPAKQCLSVAIVEKINEVRRQVSSMFSTSTIDSAEEIPHKSSGRNSMGVSIR